MRRVYWNLLHFIVLSFLFTFTQFDLEAIYQEYDQTVSLGTACQGAWQLEVNNMRKLAYPFDWWITPFHALMPFLDRQGADFLDKNKLEIINVLEGNPSILHVRDIFYDIHLVHDFLAPDIPFSYKDVKRKYERRIQRFFHLLESNKTILFIRVQISRHEAEQLDAFLHTTYPQLKYTLVAINDDTNDAKDWGLERIRNFYMKQTPGDWQGDHAKWKEILSQFYVKPSAKSRSPEEKW